MVTWSASMLPWSLFLDRVLVVAFFWRRATPCPTAAMASIKMLLHCVCLRGGRIDDGFWFTHKNYILYGWGRQFAPLCSVVYKTEELRKNQKCLSKGATYKKERKANEADRRRQFWHGGYYSSAAEHLVGGGVASSSSVMFVSFIVVLHFKKLKN